MRLKSKYDSIICILLDIPCYYATKTKETNQITECGNKDSPSKGYRRMDTTCIERYLMQNHPKVIQSLCIDNCTDGDEDDQIQCFKPVENPYVAILGDISEATSTEMLIDEDEEGRRRD